MTAVSGVERALLAAEASQPALNAFTSIEAEAALARAQRIDEARERGEPGGPLAGVAVALKDLLDHEGRVTTAGSAFYRHHAKGSAPAVARLEQAGAVVIGRTGLHEFAFGFSSENPHFGPIRNPWDTSTSPGGSSGGSAVAVAAGITPIAIGTDTGGSVRVPAALCGCYGLKVTHGRIPISGVFPLAASIDTVGPLADSIDSLEVAYRAMSGDGGDKVTSRPLRIGLPQPWLDQSPTEEPVASAFEDAVETLRGLGHTVNAVDLPGVLPGRELIYAIADEVSSVHRPYREQGLPYGDEVARRVDDAIATTATEREQGREWQIMIRAAFAEAFGSVDLLVTPSTPALRKVIGVDTIGGRHYRAVLSWFSALVNHAHLPAIAMPLSGTGAPPVSLQAIGPSGSETILLGLGRSLEDAGLVGFTPAPTSGNAPGG